MPKAYSENERNYIINKLKSEAKLLFSQYGVKKTTVDELVSKVNIPKGTFYLFYASKELLLFDILLEEQALIHAELIEAVTGFAGSLTKEQFSDFIFRLYQRTVNSFLYPIFTTGEYELLLRKLPEEVIAKNTADDNLSMEKLFTLIPQAREKDIKLYSAAFRAIFLMPLHKKEIGEELFSGTIKLLIDGIVNQIFEEEK